MVKILHLEDDIALREIIHATLTSTDPNIDIVQFDNSDDAARYLEKHAEEIDLFVVDIRVPGASDGMEIARLIRSLKVSAPIMIASAYVKPNAEHLKALKCKWLPKPWGLDVIDSLLPLAEAYHQKRQ